jgi:hypothetical protein
VLLASKVVHICHLGCRHKLTAVSSGGLLQACCAPAFCIGQPWRVQPSAWQQLWTRQVSTCRNTTMTLC